MNQILTPKYIWLCFTKNTPKLPLLVQWGDNQYGVFEFAMKEISMLPTLIASWELKNWYFTMKFLSQHHLYVNNTCTKFQGQKIYQKKNIQNLPTCVAVKKISLLPILTTSQGLKFFFCHEIFGTSIFLC